MSEVVRTVVGEPLSDLGAVGIDITPPLPEPAIPGLCATLREARNNERGSISTAAQHIRGAECIDQTGASTRLVVRTEDVKVIFPFTQDKAKTQKANERAASEVAALVRAALGSKPVDGDR